MIRNEGTKVVPKPRGSAGKRGAVLTARLRRGAASLVVGATLLSQPIVAAAAPGTLDTNFGPGSCLPVYPGYTSVTFEGNAGSCPDDQSVARAGTARALLWQTEFSFGDDTIRTVPPYILAAGSIDLGEVATADPGALQTAFVGLDLQGDFNPEFRDGYSATSWDGKMTDGYGEVAGLISRFNGLKSRRFIALVETGSASAFNLVYFERDGSVKARSTVSYLARNGVAGVADLDGDKFVVVSTDRDASGKGEVRVRYFDSTLGNLSVGGTLEKEIGNSAMGSTGVSYQATSVHFDAVNGFLYIGGSRSYPAGLSLRVEPVVFKVAAASGALDTSFGVRGMARFSLGGVYGSVNSIRQLSNGTIIAGGTSKVPNFSTGGFTNAMAVAQLDPASGTLVGSRQIGLANGVVAAIAVDSNDRIVVAGSADGPSVQQSPAVAVARLLPDLSMDSEFGTNGTTVAPASDHASRARDVMIDPVADDIYVAAEAGFYSSLAAPAVATPHLTVGKFHGGPNCFDGRLDPTEEDTDGDGVEDRCDNCVRMENPDQSDIDADGLGDVCDNCVDVCNPDQADTDGDCSFHAQGPQQCGDVCDVCPNTDVESAFCASTRTASNPERSNIECCLSDPDLAPVEHGVSVGPDGESCSLSMTAEYLRSQNQMVELKLPVGVVDTDTSFSIEEQTRAKVEKVATDDYGHYWGGLGEKSGATHVVNVEFNPDAGAAGMTFAKNVVIKLKWKNKTGSDEIVGTNKSEKKFAPRWVDADSGSGLTTPKTNNLIAGMCQDQECGSVDSDGFPLDWGTDKDGNPNVRFDDASLRACCDMASNFYAFETSHFSSYAGMTKNCSEASRAKLKVKNLHRSGGSQKLDLKFDLLFDPEEEMAWNPAETGIRVRIEPAGNTLPLDVEIPAGLYSRETREGWKVIRGGYKWSSRQGPGGLSKVILRAITPGRIQVKVRGEAMALPSIGETIHASVDLAPKVFSPFCAKTVEGDSWRCRSNRSGSLMTCR